MTEIRQWLIPLCIAAAAVLFCLHKCGLEEIDRIMDRMQQRLTCWIYKFSLWKDTEKLRRSYRYFTCKRCGYRYRVDRKQAQKSIACPHCKYPKSVKRKEIDYE